MHRVSLSAIGLLGAVAIQALVQAPSVLPVNGGDTPPPAAIASHVGPKPNLAPPPGAVLTVAAMTCDELRSARASAAAGYAGQAEQSLEKAELRAIWYTAPDGQAGARDNRQLVADIRGIRQALNADDGPRAIRLIDLALAHAETPASPPAHDEVDRPTADTFKPSDLQRPIRVVRTVL